MRIQHNIMAMNAYRNYKNNTSALSKNLERLSSGYKINRAGDDAAGLAISEKMRAQITGLEAAQKNVKDGISLVNTAEGAMQEIQDMLNRMVSLATQSANGTYDNEVDRKNLQAEVEQLKSEIDRIADSANFNGIKLLDGSLDTTNTAGRTNVLEEATSKGLTLPDAGTTAGTPNTDMIGDKTVLKKKGSDAAETEFSVNLRTLGVNAADSDEMEISIGNDKVTIKFDENATTNTLDAANNTITVAAGEYNADELGDIIAEAFNSDDTTTAITIGGQKFSATNTDGVITFKQLAAPTDSTEVVGGALEVSVQFTPSGGTPTTFADTPTYELSGTANKATLTGSTIDDSGFSDPGASGVTFTNDDLAGSGAGLDTSAIEAVIDGIDSSLEGNINIELIEDENGGADSLGLYLISADGNTKTLLGTAAMPSGDIGSAGVDISFTSEGGTSGDLGTISVKATGADVSPTAIFTATAPLDLSIVTDTSNPGSSATIAGTEDLANALADAGAQASDSIKIQRNANNDGWEITAGTAKIDVADGNATATSGVLTLTDANGKTLMTMTSSDTNTTDNDFKTATAFANGGTGFDTGLTVSEKQTNPGGDTGLPTGPSGQYEGKTTLITSGSVEKADQLASTTLELGKDVAVVDGGTLKIGDTEFVFKVGAESTVEASGENQVLIDLSAYEADSTELLSQKTASGAFDIGYESNGHKLGVFEQAKQSKYTEAELGTKAEFEKLFSTGTIAKTEKADAGKALQLQIGDTSDSYNQLAVSVGDMHVDAMVYEDEKGNKTSIKELDISYQEGAQKAIDVIKNAINYVSSVRGTLGALSNRLDHTANNLSVMAENITDAESTIRDTDIAEEMMAYTKNNILVQSAQAMLAQANQVPQGVLQLLQ